MKRTYSRGALGVIAMYGVMSAVSAIVMALSVGVNVGIFALMNREALPKLLEKIDPAKLDMEIISSFLQLIGASRALVIGMVLGSGIGLGVGMLILKKILPKETYLPIPKKRLSFSEFGIYLLVAFGVWGVGAALGNIGEFVGISMDNAILDNAGNEIVWYYIYAVLGAPVLEELAFRKIFLDRTHLFGETCAAFISALSFGLFHGNSMQFFLAFAIGLVNAVCYQRTGKVIYCILIHFFINLTGTIAGFFELANIEIDLIWNISVLILIIAGILAIFAYRDHPIFKLSLPGTQDANRQIFKNAGMRILLIGGLVTVLGTDLSMMIMNLTAGKGIWSLITLIPMFFTLASVLALRFTVGRHVLKPVCPVEYVSAAEIQAEEILAAEVPQDLAEALAETSTENQETVVFEKTAEVLQDLAEIQAETSVENQETVVFEGTAEMPQETAEIQAEINASVSAEEISQ